MNTRQLRNGTSSNTGSPFEGFSDELSELYGLEETEDTIYDDHVDVDDAEYAGRRAFAVFRYEGRL